MIIDLEFFFKTPKGCHGLKRTMPSLRDWMRASLLSTILSSLRDYILNTPKPPSSFGEFSTMDKASPNT